METLQMIRGSQWWASPIAVALLLGGHALWHCWTSDEAKKKQCFLPLSWIMHEGKCVLSVLTCKSSRYENKNNAEYSQDFSWFHHFFSCGSECLHICQRERRNASAIVSAALLNQRLHPSSLNFRQNMRVRAKDGRLPKEGWTVAVILLSTVALMTDVYSKSTVAPGNVPAYH